MNGEFKSDLSRFAQSASAWVGIGGAVFGVLSFFAWLGVLFGPLSKLPAQQDVIISELQELKSNMKHNDWQIETLKTRDDSLAAQLLSSAEDRVKIWDRLRAVDADASMLKQSSISREDMIEWIAAMANRNKALSVPPLIRQRE